MEELKCTSVTDRSRPEKATYCRIPTACARRCRGARRGEGSCDLAAGLSGVCESVMFKETSSVRILQRFLASLADPANGPPGSCL